MINKKVIDNIYKQFSRRPASPEEELDLPLLFRETIEHHTIFLDDNRLIIEDLDETSPFHVIPLAHIHAILDFDRRVAIVLENAIIFFDKLDEGVHIHIRQQGPSLMDRLRMAISSEKHPDF